MCKNGARRNVPKDENRSDSGENDAKPRRWRTLKDGTLDRISRAPDSLSSPGTACGTCTRLTRRSWYPRALGDICKHLRIGKRSTFNIGSAGPSRRRLRRIREKHLEGRAEASLADYLEENDRISRRARVGRDVKEERTSRKQRAPCDDVKEKGDKDRREHEDEGETA